jgi:hypothetical protein
LLPGGLAREDAAALCDSTVTAIKRSAGRPSAFAVFSTLHGAGLFGDLLRRSSALDELLPTVSVVDVRHVSPTVRGLFVQQLLWELALEAASSSAPCSVQGRSVHFRVGWHQDSAFQRHVQWLRKEVGATMKLAAPKAEWLHATQHSVVLQWAHLHPWLAAAGALIHQRGVTALTPKSLGALSSFRQRPDKKAKSSPSQDVSQRAGGNNETAKGRSPPSLPWPAAAKQSSTRGGSATARVSKPAADKVTPQTIATSGGSDTASQRTVIGVSFSSK